MGHIKVRISLEVREAFLSKVNAAYATLRADPKRWQAIEAERADWDITLADGLPVSERIPESAS